MRCAIWNCGESYAKGFLKAIFLNQVLKAVAVDKAWLLRSRWQGQLLPLLGQSGVGKWETLLLLMHKKTGRMMWFPLACMNSSVMLSLLPSFSQPFSLPAPLPLSCPSLPGGAENPRPITWANILGSFVGHHHKDPVHMECLPFIHN